MASANSGKASYLIVGSGVFGVSTAYYLTKAYPEASIVVLDRSLEFPCHLAASHDINKIVRADYDNSFYCGLAIEAKKEWESNPLYAQFYHQSGLVRLDYPSLGRSILKNYEDLKVSTGASIITPDEMKVQHEGLFADADCRGVSEIFYNPSSGWADATSAVNAVVTASIAGGAEFIQGDVERLEFDGNGDCTGVKCTNGRVSITFHGS